LKITLRIRTYCNFLNPERFAPIELHVKKHESSICTTLYVN
jgi:hypothetical protein